MIDPGANTGFSGTGGSMRFTAGQVLITSTSAMEQTVKVKAAKAVKAVS